MCGIQEKTDRSDPDLHFSTSSLPAEPKLIAFLCNLVRLSLPPRATSAACHNPEP